MLLSESVCLGSFEVATLRQLICSSKILEDDRKAYLLQELTQGVIGTLRQCVHFPRADDDVDWTVVGTVAMESAEAILRDPKTLIFFLAAFEYQQEKGTIMIIVQSALHILHVVFLRRQITKTTRNEQGVFSFQFGPSRRSPPNTSPSPTTVTTPKPSAVSPVRALSGPGPAFRRLEPSQGTTPKRGKLGTGPSSPPALTDTLDKYLQGAKRPRAELLVGGPAPHVRTLTGAGRGGVAAGAEDLQQQTLQNKQQALEAQVRALQLALLTSSKSILAGAEATRLALETKYARQLQSVREENASLKRATDLLLKQNQVLVARLAKGGSASTGGIGASDLETAAAFHTHLPPPPPTSRRSHSTDSVLGSASRGGPPAQLDSRWQCRWGGCGEAPYPNRDLLWRHVVSQHIRSQYRPDKGTVDLGDNVD